MWLVGMESVSVVVLTTLIGITVSLSDDNEYRLVRDVMTRYDKRIRPVINSSHALNVTFGLALAQIIDVDEKNQIMTTNCWLNQHWFDDNLKWDPKKYGSIRVIRLPHTEIWKPDILLYNNADVSSYHTTVSTNVIVTYDGNVTWLSMVIFKSSCSISVRYFPFDQQNCTLVFGSWTYDGFQINLKLLSDTGDSSNYIQNSEWELFYLDSEASIKFYSCCDEPYPLITYIIHIRRLPLYYVFNMVLPCLLITFVALLGFYIPSDSGEKINMGITTLLSMTVFMMLVAENMPPTSDNLPLLSLYYGLTIGVVSFATGFSVFTLNIHYKGNRGSAVPDYIKDICFGVFAKLMCIHVDAPIKQQKHHNKGTTLYSPDDFNPDAESNRRTPYVRFKIANEDRETYPGRHNNKAPPNVPPPLIRDYTELKTGCRETTFNNVISEAKVDNDNEPFLIPENGSTYGATRMANRLVQGGACAPEDFEMQFSRVLQKIQQTIEMNELRLMDSEQKEAMKYEWQLLGRIVDRFLLIVFVIGVGALTLSTMLQRPDPEEFIKAAKENV